MGDEAAAGGIRLFAFNCETKLSVKRTIPS
jgi:hypothetical protein